MGALASLFASEKKNKVDIFLDFEKAEPGDTEKELHGEVSKILGKSEEILDRLFNYKGCEEFIRKAITTPGPDSEQAAWDAILPSVSVLQEFYEFGCEIEKIYPKLIKALFGGTNPNENLKGQQSLAKQLADIIDFALRFDDAKMVNPAIQNDFSFYRRSLAKMKMTNRAGDIKIKDELANRMSLFFAYPTPMMKVLVDTTVEFLNNPSSGVPKDQVVKGFALMANVCTDMVENNRFTSAKTNMFCLRAATGSIVLVDHIDDQGSFHKKSEINIRTTITQLKTFSDANTDGLLNALRFTTKHLNDPETPANIKNLLA